MSKRLLDNTQIHWAYLASVAHIKDAYLFNYRDGQGQYLYDAYNEQHGLGITLCFHADGNQADWTMPETLSEFVSLASRIRMTVFYRDTDVAVAECELREACEVRIRD
jgi:hypothetical protein